MDTPPDAAYQPALPFDDPRHLRAHHFLVEEAHLLDRREWSLWLGLLTDDVRYRMPVRVTTASGAGDDTLSDMAHFDEDRYSMERRVKRLGSEYAWTEDPPSRTRHLVTNVRTHPGPTDDELTVESSLLLFRSRGDDRPAELLCAHRADTLRHEPDGLRLAERVITIEESVLRTQNLAVFL